MAIPRSGNNSNNNNNNNNITGASSHRTRSPRVVSGGSILLCALTGGIGFYAGAAWGMHAAVRPGGLCSPSLHDRKDATDESTTTETTASSHRRRTDTNRFPLSVSTIAAGLALVDRNEFAKRFDMGVPLDASLPHNDKVLLIYQRPYSLPENKLAAEQAKIGRAHV